MRCIRVHLSFRELLDSLGDADTIEAQSKAILMENDVRDEEFSDEVSVFDIARSRGDTHCCLRR